MIQILGKPRRKGRIALAGALFSSLVLLGLIVAPIAQGLTQTDFELDKNATNDLSTTHLGVLSSNISATATSFVVCQLVVAPATPFTIQIAAEQMSVTAVTGTGTSTGGCPAGTINKRTYAVTRHVNGTTAGAHAASEGDVTLMVITAGLAGDDWDQVYAEVQDDPDTKCVDLGAVECAFVSDPKGVSIFSTGSSKDDLNINGGPGSGWLWTDGSVPDADEILDGYAAKYDTGGHQILYFGADRYATNGSKDFGFWFFHGPVGQNDDGTFSGTHTAHDDNGTPGDLTDDTSGDILILGTFTQGGATVDIRVFEWVGTGGNTNTVLNGPTGALGDCVPGSTSDTGGCATVNNTSIPSPWAYVAKGASVGGFIPSGGAVEGGIDLTDLHLTGCFSSFMAETRSSPEIGAQLKDFILGQFEACGSELTTTPSNGAGTNPLTDSDDPVNGLPDVQIGTGAAGVDVTDAADVEVTGTAFTGTVDFYLCGPIDDPDTCDTGGVLISSEAVTGNGTVYSDSANLTSVGRYCWRGEFTSDTEGVPDATDSLSNECFEVKPVTPDLDTQAVDAAGADQIGAVAFGEQVFDKATLSGTAYKPGTDGDAAYPTINATMDTPAAGTITFELRGPDGATADCVTVATSSDAAELNPQDVAVTGDDDYFSAGFTPDLPGVYHWVASYDGDSPNTLGTDHNTACDDTNEDVTVQQLQPTMDTAQNFVPNDSATISVAAGTGDLDGYVVFNLYVDDTDCSDPAVYTSAQIPVSDTDDVGDVTLTDTVDSDNADAYGTTGTTFSWVAEFHSNNSAHVDVSSPCGNETSSITIDNGAQQPPAGP